MFYVCVNEPQHADNFFFILKVAIDLEFESIMLIRNNK